MISNKSVLAILANCGTVGDVDSYIAETEMFLNELKSIKAEMERKNNLAQNHKESPKTL